MLLGERKPDTMVKIGIDMGSIIELKMGRKWNYIINYQNLQGIGMTVQSSTAILGEISISGMLIKVDNLADTLQVCLDSGAKKVLLPQTSFVDFATVPPELMSAFQLIPNQSTEDAVFKALGVE